MTPELIPEYTKGYLFDRLAKKTKTKELVDKSWNDIINRFIDELIKRGARTSREDLEWLCLNYYALPNSPALLTAGNGKFYASACSSYPIMDSLDEGRFSITDTLSVSTSATKAGIGTGYNFSNLRSKDETVQGKSGVTSGPVGFLKSYSGFMSGILQATRKSASMGLLHVDHPDIEEYINCKAKDKEISNFNLSVVISDEFMEAVEKDTNYTQKYRNTPIKKEVKAKDIFNTMCHRIWDNGEPGVIFGDTIVNDYFEPLDQNKILLNPCSEAILSHGDDWLELCVLASINLPKYMELKISDKKRVIDTMVSMLNDIIDLQDYVTPLQERGMKYINRKIGIGVAGLATVLAKKAIKYSDEKTYDFTRKIFKEIGEFAKGSSQEIFDTIHTKEMKDPLDIDSPLRKLKRYNTSLLSVAPTSSLSDIFNDINEEGCSWGIEPFFSLDPVIIKNSKGETIKSNKIVNYLGEDKAKEIIECANDLDYKAHLRPIEAYYDSNPKGIVQGCSKTVNFKNNVTLDDVKEAVIYCWKHKIKAISFYRDGSRENQVITTKDSYKDCKEVDENGRPLDINYTASPKRPQDLPCDIFHVKSQGEKWIVLIALLNGKPYELFAGLKEKIQIPKRYEKGIIKRTNHRYDLILEEPNGDEDDEGLIIRDIPNVFDEKAFALVTRLTSMGLRHGVPLGYVSDQLLKTGTMDALNKAIARCLKTYMAEENASSEDCPNCKKEGRNSKLRYISGCLTCAGNRDSDGKLTGGCGFSKCG